MPFLTLSGADVDFLSWELTEEALPTTRRVELVGSLAPIWNLGFLLDLRTRPFTVYATELARHLCTSQNVPPWYYLHIVHLSRHEARSSLDVT